MRKKLRETGAVGQTERPKEVPLTHYLLFTVCFIIIIIIIIIIFIYLFIFYVTLFYF